jgi:hypothetical protein
VLSECDTPVVIKKVLALNWARLRSQYETYQKNDSSRINRVCILLSKFLDPLKHYEQLMDTLEHTVDANDFNELPLDELEFFNNGRNVLSFKHQLQVAGKRVAERQSPPVFFYRTRHHHERNMSTAMKKILYEKYPELHNFNRMAKQLITNPNAAILDPETKISAPAPTAWDLLMNLQEGLSSESLLRGDSVARVEHRQSQAIYDFFTQFEQLTAPQQTQLKRLTVTQEWSWSDRTLEEILTWLANKGCAPETSSLITGVMANPQNKDVLKSMRLVTLPLAKLAAQITAKPVLSPTKPRRRHFHH